MTDFILTAESARAAFDYEPESGMLRWKFRPSPAAAPGSVAGSQSLDGYISLSYRYKRYVAHRVIWLIVHGEWPALEIDHIDGNRANNALTNLRLATKSQNNYNRKLCPNSSGVKNVVRVGDRWQVRIKVDGKNHHFGTFRTVDAAAVVARSARIALHGEFANHGESA